MTSAWARVIFFSAMSAFLLVFVFACGSPSPPLPAPPPPPPPPAPAPASQPPPPDLSPSKPILSSIYGYLSSTDREEPGYGLYSYVLFPVYSLRAEHFLTEVFNTTGYQGHNLIDPRSLNIIYFPTRADMMRAVTGKTQTSRAPSGHEFATESYDYALAQKLLAHMCEIPAEEVRGLCATDLSRGPYLLTYGRPMSTLSSVAPPYLVVDLSGVHIRAFSEFIVAYKEQVKRPNYPVGERIDALRLRVLNIVLSAADWIAPTTSAMADMLYMAK
jgi:hypothetical protein